MLAEYRNKVRQGIHTSKDIIVPFRAHIFSRSVNSASLVRLLCVISFPLLISNDSMVVFPTSASTISRQRETFIIYCRNKKDSIFSKDGLFEDQIAMHSVHCNSVDKNVRTHQFSNNELTKGDGKAIYERSQRDHFFCFLSNGLHKDSIVDKPREFLVVSNLYVE